MLKLKIPNTRTSKKKNQKPIQKSLFNSKFPKSIDSILSRVARFREIFAAPDSAGIFTDLDPKKEFIQK